MNDKKRNMEVLARHFGGCGCKGRCEREQRCGDDDRWLDRKPRGRFSVCEIEAEELEVRLTVKEDAE